MEDDWEDWENTEIPIIVPNEEQLKRIHEQKLIEESDNDLTRSLFSNEEDIHYKNTSQNLQQKQNVVNIEETLTKNEKNNHSKQKENEQKQKLLSKKISEKRAKREREKELFGEATEDNEYVKFEDMLYK